MIQLFYEGQGCLLTDKKTRRLLYRKTKKQIQFTVTCILFLAFLAWIVFAFIIDPQYQASSQLLIEDSTSAASRLAAEKEQIDSQVIEAYAVFATSNEVMEEVKKQLELNYSITDLRQKIQVDYASNSPVLTVTVFSEDSQQAAIIANTLSFVFQNEVKKSLNANHVSIISQASSENGKASHNQHELIFGLTIAVAFGIILIILTTFITASIKGAAKNANRDTRKKENQMQTVFK